MQISLLNYLRRHQGRTIKKSPSSYINFFLAPNLVITFTSSCPHAGCRTSWGYSNNNFRCGCHGATFNNQGSVLSAPGGTGDLISFTAVLEDDVLTVSK